MSVQVFLSYAAQDEALCEQLSKHLHILARQGVIKIWSERAITPGQDRRATLDKNLELADVIIILLSADYGASDECYEYQLKHALQRHAQGTAHILPVIARPFDIEVSPVRSLQILPRSGIPITRWSDADAAWQEVAGEVRTICTLASKPQPLPQFLPSAARFLARPRFPDDVTRHLSAQLEDAYDRKRTLLRAGVPSTRDVDAEIIDIRRALREGGQLRAGDSLKNGQYILCENIGKGGFATVWRALDRNSGNDVAIKVLHPQRAAEESTLARFTRGARVMAQLQHPHVVQIIEDVQEDGKFVFFVMELVRGGDLELTIKNRRIPRDRIVPLICEVGRALIEAHEKKLLHRDVKPSNILLGLAMSPKLSDFDLVAREGTTGGTKSGALGTFLYAAPEMLTRPQDADQRADVFSLAATCVFCLHGTDLPFAWTEQRRAFVAGLPCPNPVASVLLRATRANPDQRYKSVAEFLAALVNANGEQTRWLHLGPTVAIISVPVVFVALALAFDGAMHSTTGPRPASPECPTGGDDCKTDRDCCSLWFCDKTKANICRREKYRTPMETR